MNYAKKIRSVAKRCDPETLKQLYEKKTEKTDNLLNYEHEGERVNLSPEEIEKEYIEFYKNTYGVEPLIEFEEF